MVNLLGWCLCGLLIGWVTDRLSQRRQRSALIVYGTSGVMGAILTGAAALTFEPGPLGALSPVSLGAAALGAVLAVGLARLLLRLLS